MKERMKGFALGIVVAASLFGTVAYAAEGTQIEVFFRNITYMFDGVQKNESTEPGFIYNGTTYVPLRFIGEAMGKKVEWDGDHNTVWIGKREGNFDYIADLNYARADGEARNNAFFDNVLHIAGSVYENKGIKVKLMKSDGSNTAATGSIDYNLDGKYSTFTGSAGVDDTTKNSNATGTVVILGDGKVLTSFDTLRGGDHPKDFEVSVANITKLQIVFKTDNKDYITIDLVNGKLFD